MTKQARDRGIVCTGAAASTS